MARAVIASGLEHCGADLAKALSEFVGNPGSGIRVLWWQGAVVVEGGGDALNIDRMRAFAAGWKARPELPTGLPNRTPRGPPHTTGFLARKPRMDA